MPSITKAPQVSLRPNLWAITFAGIATIAAVAQSVLLRSDPVFPFYYLAVVFSAVLGGPRSGILTTILGAITAYFVFHQVPPSVRVINLGLFVTVSAVLISVVARMQRVTNQLKESDRRFSELLGRVELLAIMADVEGRLIYCNDHFVTVTGWPRNEIIGRDVFTFLIPPEQVPSVKELYAWLLDDKSTTSEVEILTRQGDRRLIHWTSTILRSPAGEVIGSASIGQDVTDERRAQFNNKLLASIVESTDDAVVAATLDGIVTSWNPGAERIYGYRASEMLGRSIFLLNPEDRHAEVKANLERIGAGERIQQLETVGRHHDGRLLELSITLSPIVDDAGRIVGSSAITRDIGHRKAAERALRDLSHKLFVAEDLERGRIAKELHDSTAQNLIAVMMSLESVRESASARSPQDARQIEDCLAILESSTHDIRTLAYVLHPARFDEDGLVGALQHYVTGFTERTGIHITLDLQPGFRRLSTEVEMILFRLIQEALGNIHRHARAKTGTILLRRDETKAHLEISDDGCGMPVDATGNPVKIGVGIASMRERTHQIGGSFDLDSSPDGTTIRVTVPVERRFA